ncbi:glycyl-radical enzyme activating protein [Olsenella sp. DNF00959]|uniref:glycyl-radical enzyme activating protein n=1 Tax=Olsenella sp. DNF00959 TaxID=1476999 RepID=UPI000780C5D2|nr:glycyl-radical enzyme activating protein [Olsenella sp. DNF00959]KXB61601.1 putative [benzylsuccinate synthase]-activating enzyme [Olsenella sp. DNF00959]
MQTATVFNVQKFSLNDGPGIRTVVFLKGCPLRCQWCANPESQRREPELEWERASCVGCGHCVDLCAGAGERVTGGRRHVDLHGVDACSEAAARAVAECPGHALSVVGRTRDVEGLLALCLQDKPFYEDSGGGVTLSGGEALLWPDFCVEFLGRLREEGIDSCLETEAYVPQGAFARVAPLVDHLLVDMKHWDAAAHRAGTGGGNELPLANLNWAVGAGRDVLVRTPVVPGFNADIEDARQMARLLRGLGLDQVQLLPFHNLGESKYALLERPYALAGKTNLHEEDLVEYARAYADEGVRAFF